MNREAEMKSAFDDLDQALQGLSTHEAVAFIDAEVAGGGKPWFHMELELRKSQLLWFGGDMKGAVSTLDALTLLFPDAASPLYFRGEHLLELGDFSGALVDLARCLDICDRTGEHWYEGAALLLRAYCAAKLGMLELVRRDLAGIEDGESMMWIQSEPAVSKVSIEEMLKR